MAEHRPSFVVLADRRLRSLGYGPRGTGVGILHSEREKPSARFRELALALSHRSLHRDAAALRAMAEYEEAFVRGEYTAAQAAGDRAARLLLPALPAPGRDSSCCDGDVFKYGHSICALDARSEDAERWVRAVAAESGHRVDWHYSGGRANVLYLGDYARVRAAVDRLAPQLVGTVLRVYGEEAHGPYRAGDPLPPGVLAVID